MSRSKPPAKKSAAARKIEAAGFSAETSVPLLPKQFLDPGAFKAEWTANDLKQVFSLGRRLLGHNDFIGALHRTRLDYFSDGLRLTGRAANDKRLSKWLRTEAEGAVWPLLRRLSNDAWTEWLLQDNAVAFWLTPASGELPKVVILDCELLQYTNKLGVEVLKVKVPQKTLTDAEKEAMSERWIEAYKKGTEITLDPEEDENFKVLTWEKLGNGFGMPRLKQVLDLLSTRQLLHTADWAGAWESVNVTEHWTGGHEIKQGPQAGKNTHFMNATKQKLMEKGLKNQRGGRRLVTNFDVKLAYKYLEAAFFDPKKYAGVMMHLKAWAGAPVAMIETGTIAPIFMQNFAAEGMKSRELVADFLGAIVNDPNFFPGKPKEPITLGWNPYSFLETKTMLELLRLAGANAWCSPQTARLALGFDNEVEGALLKEAHKTPEAYRPPFEAKQGMSSSSDKGGRPAKGDPAPEPAA